MNGIKPAARVSETILGTMSSLIQCCYTDHMSLHPPKHITSQEGLGLNTEKQLEFQTGDKAIGTETWGEIEEPWTESGTVIAKVGYKWVTKWEAGKSYIITKFFNPQGELVGVYCDISRPVIHTENGFEFDDMYLDVWMVPGHDPVILDEDELRDAVQSGHITQGEADQAMKTALELVDELKTNPGLLDFI